MKAEASHMEDKFHPLHVLLSAFAISSFGGLAAMLRSKQQVTPRSVFAAFLYSGVVGLVIALLWYNYFSADGNIYFLLGVSGLAGIGGTTVIDLVIQLFREGGVNIVIRHSKNTEDDDVN